MGRARSPHVLPRSRKTSSAPGPLSGRVRAHRPSSAGYCSDVSIVAWRPLSLTIAWSHMIAAARWLIVGLLLASCGSDATTGSPGDGGKSGASLDALRAAFCKAVRACCAAAGSPSEPLVDCESEFDRQIDLIALVAKGTVLLDEAKLGECLPRLEEQARTCQPPENVCVEAFSATLAEGAACERADECKRTIDRPVACLKTNVTADSGTKLGVCRPVPIGKSGEPCTSSCAKGRGCGGTISTFESDPLLTVCREDDALYCDSTRHCAPLLADGAPCSTSGCASTSYCNAVCTPRKAEGAACTSHAECRAGLGCTGGTCTTTPFATMKLCSGDYN